MAINFFGLFFAVMVFFSGSSIAFLKPLIAYPMELPKSGSLPGPKKINAMIKMITNSCIPNPNISLSSLMESNDSFVELLCVTFCLPLIK